MLCVRRRKPLRGIGYRQDDIDALARTVGQAGFGDPRVAVGPVAAVLAADRDGDR